MEELVWSNQLKNLICVEPDLNQYVMYKGILRPPLHVAALLGRSDIVELLLNSGADVDFLDEFGSSALHSALELKADCHQVVTTLLENGADINLENKKGLTPLYLAVCKQSLGIVFLILRFNPDINAKANREAFAFALRSVSFYVPKLSHYRDMNDDDDDDDFDYFFDVNDSYKSITMHLYDYGFSLPVEQLNCKELFSNAILLSLDRICVDFLNYGVDINMENEGGHTPLYLAIHTPSLSIVELILKYSPDLNSWGNQEAFAVLLKNCIKWHGGCSYTQREEGVKSDFEEDEAKQGIHSFSFTRMAKLLYDYGFSLPVNRLDDNESFINAVHLGLLRTCEDFVTRGAIKIYILIEGLELAINKQYIRIIEVILKYKPDLLSIDNSWPHPVKDRLFHYAAHYSDFSVVEFLIKLGADVNSTDVLGDTPLIAAVKSNNSAVVEVLLKGGADINKSNYEEKSPLYCVLERCGDRSGVYALNEEEKEEAMRSIEKETVRINSLLLKSGADVNWRGRNGETLLHILCDSAKPTCNVIIASALIVAGVDIDARDRFGETALHKAFRENLVKKSPVSHPDLIRLLIFSGASINLTCNMYQTPFDFALDETLFCLLPFLHQMIAANLFYTSHPKLKRMITQTHRYRERLEQELRLMSQTHIANTTITYRDFLNFDCYKLTCCFRNLAILLELKADGFKNKFPLYASLIKMKVFFGISSTYALMRGLLSFTALSDTVALPAVCCEEILSYLDRVDLWKIGHLGIL